MHLRTKQGGLESERGRAVAVRARGQAGGDGVSGWGNDEGGYEVRTKLVVNEERWPSRKSGSVRLAAAATLLPGHGLLLRLDGVPGLGCLFFL